MRACKSSAVWWSRTYARARRPTSPRPRAPKAYSPLNRLRRHGADARRSALVALLLTPLTATAGLAQVQASLDAGAGRSRLSPLKGADALLLQPRLSLWAVGGGIDLDGRLSRFGGGQLTADISGEAWWAAPGPGETRLRFGLEAAGSWYDRSSANGRVLGTAQLALDREPFAAWLGGGLGGAGDGAGWGALRALDLGGRITVRGISIGVSAAGRSFDRSLTTIRDSVIVLPPDTVVPIGRFTVTETVAQGYADGELTLGWSKGRMALQLALGGRLGESLVPDERWARFDGALALTPGLMAVFSAGRVAGTPERGLGSEPHYLLGLQLTLPRRSPAVSPERRPTPGLQVVEERSGARTLRIRVPDAERVELMGDFTDWRPVDMERAGDGFWRLRLFIAPGVYRLNLRVDGGAWRVPPGLTPLPDEFNGSVGELVID